ncbi:MAG: hypothetical protein ACKOEM_20290 [Planctomycetia bacterium]
MIIGGRTWPKDRRWIVAITAIALAALGWYVVEWRQLGHLPEGSSRVGLTCGIAGGAIILFELLLWPRKRVRSWRLGSAQSWLRAHVWLGLLAVPLVLLHARLLFIGGLLNQALMVVFFIVIVSGIWGLVLQQYLPKALLEQVPAETIYDQIDHVARQQCHDVWRLVDASCVTAGDDHHHADPAEETADEGDHAVVTGFRAMTGIQGRVVETLAIHAVIPGTDEVRRRFVAEVRPYLLTGARGGSALATAPGAARFFADLRGASPAEAGWLIERIEQACDCRRQFDLQARLHRWLHVWILVHLPLSVVLGVLLAVHVPIAFNYW